MVAFASATGVWRLVRRAALPAVLIVALLVGIAAMHGAVVRGGVSEGSGLIGLRVADSRVDTPATASGAAARAGGDHANAEGPGADHAGAHGYAVGTTSHSVHSGGPTGCAHCGDGDVATLVMTCALTLLVAVAAVVSPRRVVPAARSLWSEGVRLRVALPAPHPPPSLRALCVSRT